MIQTLVSVCEQRRSEPQADYGRRKERLAGFTGSFVLLESVSVHGKLRRWRVVPMLQDFQSSSQLPISTVLGA
jgi:hypothetical protein